MSYCKWTGRMCNQADYETGMCATSNDQCIYIEDYDERLCSRYEESESE